MKTRGDCSCWQIPTSSGDLNPLRWVCLHPEIEATTTTGRSQRGFSSGAGWWGPPEAPEVLMEVDTEQGDSLIMARADLNTATPIGGLSTVDEFIEAMQRLLTCEPTDHGDTRFLRLLVGTHETVDVEITWHHHRCSPPPRPDWASRDCPPHRSD